MNRFFDRLPVIGRKIPGKITLSFLMLIFATALLLAFRTTDRLTCVFAMMLSFVGDIALNHNPDHSNQTNRDFVIGGVAFILAHMMYCFSYLQKISSHGFGFVNPGIIAVPYTLTIVTVLLVFMKSLNGGLTKLFWFGIAYLWITGLNYMTIVSYAYSARSTESFVLLGCMMFFASDLIIGLEKFFGLKSRLARELVWWLYPIGQIIIIAMA